MLCAFIIIGSTAGSSIRVKPNNQLQKDQLSFATFTDTHIGARYQYPWYRMADHLDDLAEDLTEKTNTIDFVVHLGDIINHNTAQVNGVGLPWYVNKYKNNLQRFLISHLHLPFHCVIGNHDVNDYELNPDDPHNLTKSLIDELSMNNPVYAMMRDGILFLVIPELGYVQWTHPVEYTWVEFMTSQYPTTTTIILCHQAIEDTTMSEESNPNYRAKQDIAFWTSLFQRNPQIKMWIHGHNHRLDWYHGNQSTGASKPVQWFGHDMVFSSPYAQLDFARYHEEDRIVIYNISSTAITTATWEHNHWFGQWSPDYTHTWNVTTTYDPDTPDWYAFPMFLQDNETQLTDMKVLSPTVTLQLVGTKPMDLFYDPTMESPSSNVNEVILGFGDDQSGNVIWNNPGMMVHGPTALVFPEKKPSDKQHEDGRSGQPYQCFPMGTICAAVPGQTYVFTITARSTEDTSRIILKVNCSDWSTRSQYSTLPGSSCEVINHSFSKEFETIQGTYTVPTNQDAWFLQGSLTFDDTADYEVSLFRVQRQAETITTDDFHLCLSGRWYNATGMLHEHDTIDFIVNPQLLSDNGGVMNFTASINGNHYGMVNVVYHEPVLLGRNARFRIDEHHDNVYNITLTKTISRKKNVITVTNHIANIFFPEKLIRFLSLLRQLVGDSELACHKTLFQLYPFSTDQLYDDINIDADDSSGKKHISTNGNIWLTCSCPNDEERHITVRV